MIIDNSIFWTGALKSILISTEKLRNRFNFFFILPTNIDIDKKKLKSKRISYLPFVEIQKNWRILIYFPMLIINGIRLTRLIRKNKIKILHVNDLYNMLGILVKLLNPDIRVIYHIRLLPYSYAKKLFFVWKWVIEKFADQIICVSQTAAAPFKSDCVSIIYDSIDSSSYQVSKVKDNEEITILYLSNYMEGKGHIKAVEAFCLALPKILPSKLLFVGGGLKKNKAIKYRNNLIDLVHHRGMSDVVKFYDVNENVEELISSVDIMLNFSESESFSMTTLEAMVYGTPIIATDCGGPSEIIEHEHSGLIVPVNDVTKMASAMELLVNDINLRQTFSTNGVKRAMSKFNLNDQKDKLNAVYTSLLNLD